MQEHYYVGWSIVLFLLHIPFYSLCMETSVNMKLYREKCQNIDKKHDCKLKKFIFEVTEENSLCKMGVVERELHAYKEAVDQQKEFILQGIKTQYHISDSLWNDCIVISNTIQKQKERSMHVACAGVIHDEIVPQWFVAMLKQQLLEEGFNPQRTHLYNNKDLIMGVKGVETRWEFVDEKLVIAVRAPGVITINSEKLLLSSLDAEVGRCMLLAKMMRSLQGFDLLSILQFYDINITNEDRVRFGHFKWAHCSYVLALKNQWSAHCIKSYCSAVSHSDCLVDYKQLSSIEYNWRALEWLRKYFSAKSRIPLMVKAYDEEADEVINLPDRGTVIAKKIVDGEKRETAIFLIKELLEKVYIDQ